MGQRRISSGWSTEDRRSSVRSGIMDVMACRFCFVSRGFNRRRRSLQEALVSVVGCERGWVWGRNCPLASSREEIWIAEKSRFDCLKILTARYQIEHLPLLWNSGECSCVLMMFTASFGGVPEGGREVRGRSSLTCTLGTYPGEPPVR